MSFWGQVAGQASAIVLGLGGIYATYRSGTRQDRAVRHNARAEALYTEMLDSLEFHIRNLQEFVSGAAPVSHGVHSPTRIAARVRLFATPAVQSAWIAALTRLARVAEEESESGASTVSVRLHLAYDEVLGELLNEMRSDLSIPHHGAPRQRIARRRLRKDWQTVAKWTD